MEKLGVENKVYRLNKVAFIWMIRTRRDVQTIKSTEIIFPIFLF